MGSVTGTIANPYSQIDAIVVRSLVSPSDDQPSSISELIRAICDASGEAHTSNPADPLAAIVNHESDPQARQLGAVTFVRLLGVQSPLVEPAVQHRVFPLLDQQLSDDLYPALKIEPKRQAFEKCSAFQACIKSIEQSIADLEPSLPNLNALHSFRQTFMRTLNSKPFKIIVHPFLPQSLISNARLDQLFNSVTDYIEARDNSPENLFAAAENARQELNSFLIETRAFETVYCNDLLAAPLQRLLNLLVQDISSSPQAQPAHLALQLDDKKYPLQYQSHPFNLRVIVENSGPGYALDAKFTISDTTCLETKTTQYYLGRLAPGSHLVEIPAFVTEPTNSALAAIELSWFNSADRSSDSYSEILEFEAQSTNIPWEDLRYVRPYDLEPVENETDLVGRSDVLGALAAQVLAPNMTSAYIQGQKRVGKTSIVKTLQTTLLSSNIHVLYLESGDFIVDGAAQTIDSLSRLICQRVIASDARLHALPIPEFKGAFAPLAEFFDSVCQSIPDYRLLIVLDEFDELPVDLYKHSGIGDTFFLSLRSISNRKNLAFILVGGERLALVISSQGDRLNKFSGYQVDYFDRAQHWNDFQNLVRQPVAQWLEVVDDALQALYEQSAGNPFFTKVICQSLFQLAVDRRDAYVTRREIEEAVKNALHRAGVNIFQHFWEDGILDAAEPAEQLSLKRRFALLAIAQSVRACYELGERALVDFDYGYQCHSPSVSERCLGR